MISQEVPQGYKQTKVGVVPVEWEEYLFDDIFVFSTGKNIKQNEASIKFNIPCIRYGELYHMYKEVITNVINKTNLDKSELLFSKGNEILLPSAGEDPLDIGSASALTLKDIAIGRTINILRPIKEDIYSQIYMAYYITNQLKRRIASLAKGSSISNVYNSDLKKIRIPLPPLKEQQKIAQILATWDRAIEKLEALIEEKERLKKGLMQKLLNGEVRFGVATLVADKKSEDYATKVASPEWEEVRLGDVGITYGGLTGKKAEDFGIGNSKYVTYKNIFDNSKLDIELFEHVKIESTEQQNKVEYGDILFTTSSETPEEVGMSSVLLDNIDELYLNSFCFGYRVNDFEILNPNFARFYFRSFYMRDKISRLAQGSTRFNLSKLQVMKIKVKLPPLKEQQKIAQVLTTADKEIELLKKELEELKEQKRGLMQKLLTGKVRVKI